MDRFSSIYQTALDRKGGPEALKLLLPKIKGVRSLKKVGDDRFLSEMTRCIFQAGFVWRVVDRKWEDFEDVFFGFPPEKILMLSPDQIDKICQNPRIIRNRQKVLSIQHNAQYILDINKEHGSFATFVANWPTNDLISLFRHLNVDRHAKMTPLEG